MGKQQLRAGCFIAPGRSTDTGPWSTGGRWPMTEILFAIVSVIGQSTRERNVFNEWTLRYDLERCARARASVLLAAVVLTSVIFPVAACIYDSA